MPRAKRKLIASDFLQREERAGSARAEAKGLLVLLQTGTMDMQDVIHLIEVTGNQRLVLEHLFTDAKAKRTVDFREQVLAEFLRLSSRTEGPS